MQPLTRVMSLFALLLIAPPATAQVEQAEQVTQVEDAGSATKTKRRRELPGEDWSGSVGVGTNFPLDIAARFLARSPRGLRGSFSMGYLPQAYVRAINGVVVGAGGYDQATAEVVRAALEQSIVLRSHFGWSPFRTWGPYAEAGYGFLSLGGSATTGEVLAQLTNQPFPPAAASAMPTNFAVDAVLHQIDLEVGWDFPLSEALELRAGLGVAFTVAADADIEPEYETLPTFPVEPFTRYAEEYLEYLFKNYGHLPVASMSLGYRF